MLPPRIRSLLLVMSLFAVLAAGCTSPAPQGDVVMQAVAFEPVTLTVAVGDEVVWENRSGLVHTVTSNGDAGPLDSGDIAPGDTFGFRFTQPGTYAYHCMPHSTQDDAGTYRGMVATIVVE